MFPSEMVILMTIVEAGGFGRKLVNQLDITGEYIGYLYDSLVKRGYLKRSPQGYELTSKGREAVLDFLHANKASVRERIKTLEKLRIQISEEIAKLESKSFALR